MDGKEDAHAQDGHKYDSIIQGMIRSAGSKKQDVKTSSDHKSRQQIDLDNLS